MHARRTGPHFRSSSGNYVRKLTERKRDERYLYTANSSWARAKLGPSSAVPIYLCSARRLLVASRPGLLMQQKKRAKPCVENFH